MIKVSLFIIGLCCCVAAITAAPTNLDDATLKRLLRLLVNEEKKEDKVTRDLEMEGRQVSFVSTQIYSLTVYLQRNSNDNDQNNEYTITWTDGTNQGSGTAHWNDNPSHKYRIENLTPNTQYTIKVCRHSTSTQPEIVAENPVCTMDLKHSTKSE